MKQTTAPDSSRTTGRIGSFSGAIWRGLAAGCMSLPGYGHGVDGSVRRQLGRRRGLAFFGKPPPPSGRDRGLRDLAFTLPKPPGALPHAAAIAGVQQVSPLASRAPSTDCQEEKLGFASSRNQVVSQGWWKIGEMA